MEYAIFGIAIGCAIYYSVDRICGYLEKRIEAEGE